MTKLWEIVELGDYSMTLASTQVGDNGCWCLPNPDDAFIAKYGKMEISQFRDCFELKVKEYLHNPETVILYFEDKVPEWAEVGMKVIY